jgi:uncharacterized protein (DUF58 family)
MATMRPLPPWRALAWARARWRRYWVERLPARDAMLLTQRNVYILPTRPGFMLGATLMVLLVASINYQLNLGYLLTFMLAGSTVVGMHLCHGTLRGLTLQLQAPEPAFAGANLPITVRLLNPRNSVRRGIGMAIMGTTHWVWADVPAQGSTTIHMAFLPQRRGLQAIPPLTAETRFPLGTFRVWTVWRPAARVLVYPQPEAHPPPLPVGEPRTGAVPRPQPSRSGEQDGVRAYRRGDPLKLVVWKKAAKADELVSRDTQQTQGVELWLDLARTTLSAAQRGTAADAKLEQALSRLCAWVLSAERQGQVYGLRLGALRIAPGSGEAHRRHCLEALALHAEVG